MSAAKFETLGKRLGRCLIERDVEIRLALVALASGEILFLVGDTGVAKTELARLVTANIAGATVFDEQIDAFTTKEDLFGPRDITAMQLGKWKRVIDHSMLSADIVVLDELFEGTTINKTMMRALNERTFRQAGVIYDVPAKLILAASNFIPTDKRMAAFYDRLVLRRVVSRIQDSGNRLAMLALDEDEVDEPILTLEEVTKAQAAVRKVKIPKSVLATVVLISDELWANDVLVSDRRLKRSMRLVRASAWLAGRRQAKVDDLWVLGHTLWTTPEQFTTVADVLRNYADPVTAEADRLLATLAEMQTQIRNLPPTFNRRNLRREFEERKVPEFVRDLDELTRKDPNAAAPVAAMFQTFRRELGTVLYDLVEA